jgi:very-short-patch-repair endonuclease
MRFSGKKTEEHKQKLRDSWKDPESLKRRMDNNKHFYNTEPELIMKQILTDLNLNYFQQYIPKDIDHPYLTDFYLPEYNTVIECDGDVFHAHPSLFKPDDIIPRKKVTARFIRERDANRTRELRDKGYIVLRFWECDLKNNPEEVILHLQSLKSDGC